MDYVSEYHRLIRDTSKTIGKPILPSQYEILDRGLPHQPPKKLPSGKMAVYSFIYKEQHLKIGRANAKSNARYTSHHYGLNAPSTLAKSLLSDKDFTELAPDNIKQWIMDNCHRIDIEIDMTLGMFTLELVESVLHYRFEPKYEGFQSQR